MQRIATITDDQISAFIQGHRLPPAFLQTARQHYLPVAARLPALRAERTQLVLGINGAQGSGKSTLADFLRFAAEQLFGWNVAVLSIDDYYLTQAQRRQLARRVHPLLVTRGVPGTHDTEMLGSYQNKLMQLKKDGSIRLPRFDKLLDDRVCESSWPEVKGPVDLVILEGWCVGTRAQTDDELEEPVNDLEKEEDPEGIWRAYVNDQLRTTYREINSRIDTLLFLRAPSFDVVYRWRMEQEKKLVLAAQDSTAKQMTEDQLRRFIQHYERLTRANLAALSDNADIVFELDQNRAIVV